MGMYEFADQGERAIDLGVQQALGGTALGENNEGGWRTSSWSTGNGACIEVTDGADSAYIAVRDSMNAEGDQLRFPQDSWRRFTEEVRNNTAVEL